ncbi:MAG: phytanoyl-CoA dioxygenase family protein [Pseudomonadales bacterium]|jgi:phytanoyl-CoA hydroxylase
MMPSLDSLKQMFDEQGYVVVPRLLEESARSALWQIAAQHLSENLAPIEYEVDVHYPGAPITAESEGAGTARRLLQTYSRHSAFRAWGTSSEVKAVLTALFGQPDVMLSQCHHNCVMTKQPGYSSVTRWHQDIRYWHFDQQSLISVWTALGEETKKNGCLRVLPGSHLWQLEPGQFDAARFLRSDLAANKALLSTAQAVPLSPGDALFFHARLFHAAGRNTSEQTKYSLVYTYHAADNHPIEATRSAQFPSIAL